MLNLYVGCSERFRITYLIVAWKGIHEAHILVAYKKIHQSIYEREQEVFLCASLIQVGVVYTHLPSVFAFGYHYHIGNPIRVCNLSNGTRSLQFLYFFSCSRNLLIGKFSLLFFYRLYTRIHPLGMSSDIQVDCWFIFRRPREYILTFHEKGT